MKNIIISGPYRVGKTTLARKLNEELNYFVISVDKIIVAFQEAYPQLNIKHGGYREVNKTNLAPFLGHYIGSLLSSNHGSIMGNRFLMEGSFFDFDKILPILKTYGLTDLKNNFKLIGLDYSKKPVDEFVSDFKRYDTKDDWTYGFNDDDLKKISEDAILYSRKMTEHLIKYGFTIYDISKGREQIIDKIVEDIKLKIESDMSQ